MVSNFMYFVLILVVLTGVGLMSRSLMVAGTGGGMTLTYLAFQSGNGYLMGAVALMLTFSGLAMATWIVGPMVGGGQEI